jgi:hypothetical protein
MHYNEYNAGETALGIRLDYSPDHGGMLRSVQQERRLSTSSRRASKARSTFSTVDETLLYGARLGVSEMETNPCLAPLLLVLLLRLYRVQHRCS